KPAAAGQTTKGAFRSPSTNKNAPRNSRRDLSITPKFIEKVKSPEGKVNTLPLIRHVKRGQWRLLGLISRMRKRLFLRRGTVDRGLSHPPLADAHSCIKRPTRYSNPMGKLRILKAQRELTVAAVQAALPSWRIRQEGATWVAEYPKKFIL